MKIRLAQTQVIPGNPKANYENCVHIISEAKKENINILVFPELVISGYLLGDKYEELDFIEDCEYYAKKLCELATQDLTIIFGNVMTFETLSGLNICGTDGRKAKLNAAYIATEKGVEYKIKSLLPNYREFEEPRHFQSNFWVKKNMPDKHWSLFEPIEINGLKIGICICEDGWDTDYSISPISELKKNGAEIIFNLSCSPFTLGKNKSRNKHFQQHACRLNTPIFYVNAVGIQNNGKTVFCFDGSSIAWDKEGKIITQAPMYKITNIDFIYTEKNILCEKTSPLIEEKTETEDIFETIKYGIQQYMKQLGLKKVVIGASGGIDSAVAAAMYVEALGAKSVVLVNMPTKFNSQTTIGLAKELAQNLGCYYCSVPIEESVKLTSSQINGLKARINDNESIEFQLSQFNLENIQARDRSGRVLAAIAASWDAVFTNNGNKTETTVGYATLYGDVAGFFAVLADLWKHQVYALGRYVNEKSATGEIIPSKVFEIVPSAELSADQSLDEGKGDPLMYPYHDRLFASWQEWWNHASLYDILKHYLDGDLAHFLNKGQTTELTEEMIKNKFPTTDVFIKDLERWWNLFKGMGIAKRIQAPPILAVSRRAYGFDYRESVCNTFYSRKYLDLKKLFID